MMISDVLSDAIAEIEAAQQAEPDAYRSFSDEIESVKAAMRALQVKLDTPPPGGYRPGEEN